MQILNVLVARMGQAPERAGELVRQRGVTADALHAALDQAKQLEIRTAGEIANQRRGGRPVFGNSAQRAAEEQNRLTRNKAWNSLQDSISSARTALRECDAALEALRMQAKADEAIMSVVAGLLGSGKVKDATDVLAAYTGGRDRAPARTPMRDAIIQKGPEGRGTETGVVTVLEVRVSNPEKGTIRAFCEREDGSRTAVFGKNGVGKTLAASIGRRVQIQYRQADKGLYAVAAETA